jgi:hypothetical protein
MQNKSINEFDYSGKVIHVGQPETYTTKTGNTKAYRILVMQFFKGTYPEEVVFEFAEQNMNQLLQITDGCWATVTFCLGGQKTIRDGKAKWWNRIEGLTCIKG